MCKNRYNFKQNNGLKKRELDIMTKEDFNEIKKKADECLRIVKKTYDYLRIQPRPK